MQHHALLRRWIGRLQRCKWLQHYQIFDARYLITLDGSRYFSAEALCPLPSLSP